MLHLDHAVIAVADLESAIQDYRDLGFTVVRGGIHANHATHNALVIFLDGTYLELLTGTGEAPLPNLIDFSVLLQNGEGLVGYALRSDDLEADVTRLRENGFTVGEIIPGERRRHDGTIIQWKLALVENGFSPFLIQDVTPREWRVPNDEAVTSHHNRAIGLGGVEIAVRSIKPSWDRYVSLLGISPKYDGYSNQHNIGDLIIHEYMERLSRHNLEELPDFLKMFAGSVPQAEIDAADAALEPQMFASSRKNHVKTLAKLRKNAEDERAMKNALSERDEALFAIHLVREQGADESFTLERTHNVRFRQNTGAPPSRGENILIGLDDLDWGTVNHAYGAATDVPTLLRSLASDDKAVRNYAYEILNGNIIHQGTIYPASIETIPFLAQLLNAPEVEDKIHLLDLLGSISFGGMGTPELKERTQILLQDVFPTYLAQLDHPDAKISSRVVEQLSLFVEQITIQEPLLRTRIASDHNPTIRSKCAQTLAELWTKSVEDESPRKLSSEQSAYFAGLMRDELQPPVVHFTAACILARDNADAWLNEVLAIFYAVMQNDETVLEKFDLHIRWVGLIFHDVLEALPGHPNQVLDWMLTQAHHPSANVRQQVPWMLGLLLTANDSNILLSHMIPAVTTLMRDPSPDVRQYAVVFFAAKPCAVEVSDVLQDLAANDPSLNIRVLARNVLASIPPQKP